MPPKARITKDRIVDAAFQLARREGFEKITAQAVARELGCSTQPIMSHFKKVEELRTAAAEKADQYHSAYLAKTAGEDHKSVFTVAHVLTVGFYFGFCELFSADITFSVIVCILMAKASITV